MAIIKCPECGKDISNKSEKCVHCGFPISNEDMIVCSDCGILNKSSSSFCSSCGKSFLKVNINENKTEIQKERPKKKKRHFLIPLFITLFFLLLILAAVITTKWAVNSGRLEIIIHDLDTNESYQLLVDDDSSNDDSSDVTFTVPAEYIGDVTQEQLDNENTNNKCKSITLNDDGSVTYVMTKSQYENMITDMKSNIYDEIDKIIEDYPTITKIDVNDNFTIFTITTTSTEVSYEEQILVLQLYIYGGLFNSYKNETVTIRVDFINANSGNIISSFNSSEQ